MFKLLLLLSTFLIISQCSENPLFAPPTNNQTIEIIQLQFWILKLPNINLEILKKTVELVGMPKELLVVFTSVGYIAIMTILAIVLILSFIAVSFMQCCCSVCSDPIKTYPPCQKLTSKFLNTMLLFSVILVCIAGIVFYAAFNGASTNFVDNVNNKMKPYRDNIAIVQNQISIIKNTSINVNTSIDPVLNMTKNIQDIDNLILKMQQEEIKKIEQIVPILVFVGIVILAITGVVSGFFEMRVVYAFIGFFFFFIFIVMTLTALVTGSASILLSDICVKGVDTQINRVIEQIPLNRCSSDLLTRYVFCQNTNMSCDPIGDATSSVYIAINNLTIEYNRTQNATILTALNACKAINTSLYTLSDCNISNQFYVSSTQIICGDLSSSILKTSVVMELISLLSFIFLLTYCYNWNRFTNPNYTPINSDFEKERNRLDNRRSKRLSSKNTINMNKMGQQQNSDLLPTNNPYGATTGHEENFTMGCFFYSFIIILIWGALISGWIAVMSLGSTKVNVNRTQ